MPAVTNVGEFDHAVIMVRDRLDELAPHYEQQGFHLTEKATHNLGSCNRLIVLDGTYIELLGWPQGVEPARQEIANSAFGLEALVFRSDDADATYARLRAAGFAVNPVQALTRPARVGVEEKIARFQTVRFVEQPIAGLRMYFCQHLTPEYVWTPESMRHANGARGLVQIGVRAADAPGVAQRLALVADVQAVRTESNWEVPLANARICVQSDATALTPMLTTLTLVYDGGAQRVLDMGL